MYQLAALVPGASSQIGSSGGMSAGEVNTPVGGDANVEFNGLRQNHNIYLLDGGTISTWRAIGIAINGYLVRSRSNSSCYWVRADGRDTCRFFHPSQHSGEIFVNLASQFLGVDVKGSLRRGHRDMFIGRSLQNQRKILVHEAQRKLRTVVMDHCTRQLSQMRRSDHCGLCQHLEQAFPIETNFLPKDDRLRNRLHADSQHSVDDQLHCRARARTAQ